jgi:hypothetical protein
MVSFLFKTSLLLHFLNIVFSTSPLLSAWKQSTGTTQTFSNVAYKTDVLSISYSNTYVYVKANGIPSYSIGPWLNPNTPSGQNWIFQFPLTPTSASSKFDLTTYPGQIGAWINGIAMYGPGDGISYGNLNVWHRNAYVFEKISFDQCLGHADVMGIYHNHVSRFFIINRFNYFFLQYPNRQGYCYLSCFKYQYNTFSDCWLCF